MSFSITADDKCCTHKNHFLYSLELITGFVDELKSLVWAVMLHI